MRPRNLLRLCLLSRFRSFQFPISSSSHTTATTTAFQRNKIDIATTTSAAAAEAAASTPTTTTKNNARGITSTGNNSTRNAMAPPTTTTSSSASADATGKKLPAVVARLKVGDDDEDDYENEERKEGNEVTSPDPPKKGVKKVPSIHPKTIKIFNTTSYNDGNVHIEEIDPIGCAVYGIQLHKSKHPPPTDLLEVLEYEMSSRGFVVFKHQQDDLNVDELLQACCWFGGKAIHSTHGIHPATPNHNKDIFRLSNHPQFGIVGVGPQYHNDGSFLSGTFSHAVYHMVKVPDNASSGSTYFSHQGVAYDNLTEEQQEYWSRLTSVNSNSGVLHPVVHTHPISKRKSVWLHLGMTGAVIEKLCNAEDDDGGTDTGADEDTGDHDDIDIRSETAKATTRRTAAADGTAASAITAALASATTTTDETNRPNDFSLLNAAELKQLCVDYNNLLEDGLTKGYTIKYEYEQGDVVIIDNLAVGHKASSEAHVQATCEEELRIMHRVTIQAKEDFAPHFGLPQHLDIHSPKPPAFLLTENSSFSEDDDDRKDSGVGVWQGGGIGFRWDDSIHMQN